MANQRVLSTFALNDQASDWGVTVSEAKAKKGVLARVLLFVAFLCLALGSFLVLPVLAGVLLSFDSQGALREVAVIGFILALALAFKWKSNNLPRNALQIDYSACEIRLGAEERGGNFVRDQVISFRDLEEVYVNDEDPRDPALCFRIPGEIVDMRFHKTEHDALHDLVGEITEARDAYLRAPIRSRIQSKIMGFEASFREAKQRITTRIVTRTAT